MTANMEPIQRLSKDLAQASVTLEAAEVRFLVDAYYTMQDNRIRADGQIRSMDKNAEPHAILTWLSDQSYSLEGQIKRALQKYAESQPIGEWLLGITGIGPVIASGLMAHIDIHIAETAGHIWRFAGQDPTAVWEKGQKRPWNARLKVVCWKAGESFVKVSGNDNDIYGKFYIQRKELEIQRNETGEFAEQAKAKLEKHRIGKTTDAYKHYSEGRLPPAHIHARAKRYAVKLFLAHLWEKWRTIEGLPVPEPYPIAILGHAHKIEI